jgi:hypothetical protein
MPISHGPENQRRDEGRQRHHREGIGLDGVQSVRRQHGTQRDKPHAQRGSLNKEQRHQLDIFRPADRFQHADRTHGAIQISSPESFTVHSSRLVDGGSNRH